MAYSPRFFECHASSPELRTPLDAAADAAPPCPSDLLCAVCHYVFDKPVMLSCGHSFCEGCAGAWLRSHRSCPTCREHQGAPPIRNIALRQVVDEHNKVLAEAEVEAEKTAEMERLIAELSAATPSRDKRRFQRMCDNRKSTRRGRVADLRRPLLLGDLEEAERDASSGGGAGSSHAITRSISSRLPRSCEATPNIRRHPSDFVYTGLTPPRAMTSTVQAQISRIQKHPNHGENSENSEGLERGGIFRRSIGKLRRSVRIFRGGDAAREEALATVQDEECEQPEQTKDSTATSSFARSTSQRRSFWSRLRTTITGKRKKKDEAGVSGDSEREASLETAAAAPASIVHLPNISRSLRILVLSSTRFSLTDALRNHNLEGVRVMATNEKKMDNKREAASQVTLTVQSSEGEAVLIDVIEGQREDAECADLAISPGCSAVLLLLEDGEPASSLGASSNFRFVQHGRRSMLPTIPIWAVVVSERGGNGGAEGGTQLAGKLLPTRQLALHPRLEAMTQQLEEILHGLCLTVRPSE